LKLDLIPFQLRFKQPFKIAHGVRETTDVVYVKLTHENLTAWGEATLPPYLPETQKSVIEFLSSLDISGFKVPFNPTQIFHEIDSQYAGNYAAKAALDMAFWHLKSQLEGTPVTALLGIQAAKLPLCTYTLGVSGFDEMRKKIDEADELGFELFKIKLTGGNDLEVIENFRKITHKRFAIDVNQGWKSLTEAQQKLRAILHFEPVFIEQPFPVRLGYFMPELMGEFQIPFYADESCQKLTDLDDLVDCFDGVNIKLMKCGGITPALDMVEKASDLGMSVLIGCMSESSVGCTAAANLVALADYADLDGPYLNVNDPFSGMTVERGRIKQNPLLLKIPF